MSRLSTKTRVKMWMENTHTRKRGRKVARSSLLLTGKTPFFTAMSAVSQAQGSASRDQGPRSAIQIDAIDALRGMAAFYVLAFHLIYVPSVRLTVPAFASSFLGAGHSGVTLFFVISAFTLCLSSDNRKKEPMPLLRFYLRRLFRIIPLFFVLLFLEVARYRFVYQIRPNRFEVATNIAFVFNFIPGHQEGIVWASWTLGVEMVFYAFFPLIFRYVNSLRRAVFFFMATIGLAATVGAAVHYRVDFFRFSIFRHLPSFACGFVLFFIFKKFRARIERKTAIGLILGGCIVHIILTLHQIEDYGQGIALQSITWAVLALGLCVLPVPLFVNRVTRYAGAISYSIYLDHPQLLSGLSPAFAFIKARAGVCQYWASLSLATTVVVIVAFITYSLIEQPGIKLGNRIVKATCIGLIRRER